MLPPPPPQDRRDRHLISYQHPTHQYIDIDTDILLHKVTAGGGMEPGFPSRLMFGVSAAGCQYVC